ncbi:MULTISPECIES: precorrin-6A synthase (deacetylating) [unclassified Chelatococcus]|uniref:precorrin-6A synthase (deacetylating) n=1 Tax=unclassified Chelatococcus TaxID=2638111 RepID=UPI001BCC2D93|nr:MULTISPECIES: precorrin-6A synthase (deacetylating) [unclassified Chelatococcus]MBS7695976.1 precorrin-6A synthase (deacetylating) [Chelatococcus sp. YT9]MBX3555649.1 precorrin-6A synthase (deacetylating) [Chelatococcus sp.]
MRKILIIGIGAGNPDYLTVQAIEALNQADVFFIPDKGEEKAALRELREEICARFVRQPDYRFVGIEIPPRGKSDDYKADVAAWHAAIEARYTALLQNELAEDETGAFLVWGDPALYDSTLRIIQAIDAKASFPFDYTVIPGISSVQALAARHRIALNRIGEPVHITTGRRLGEISAEGADTVVMLDGEQAFRRLLGQDLQIYWGAYLGTPEEILLSGPLDDVAEEIDRLRREARDANGWIMDTYLLRKPKTR